jgi:hypothetical protein
MDVFVVEGCKAIFRLALSLLQLIPKKDLKVRIIGDSIFFFSLIACHADHHRRGKVTDPYGLEVVVG